MNVKKIVIAIFFIINNIHAVQIDYIGAEKSGNFPWLNYVKKVDSPGDYDREVGGAAFVWPNGYNICEGSAHIDMTNDIPLQGQGYVTLRVYHGRGDMRTFPYTTYTIDADSNGIAYIKKDGKEINKSRRGAKWIKLGVDDKGMPYFYQERS